MIDTCRRRCELLCEFNLLMGTLNKGRISVFQHKKNIQVSPKDQCPRCRCNQFRSRSPPLFVGNPKNPIVAMNSAIAPGALAAKNYSRICMRCAHWRSARAFANAANWLYPASPSLLQEY